MTADEVRAILRQHCTSAGTHQAWADVHGLAQGYVSDVLRGRKLPGPGILKALGLVKVVSYEAHQVTYEANQKRAAARTNRKGVQGA